MDPLKKFVRSLAYAVSCVAVTLIALLISAFLTDFVIAPMLVSGSKKLGQVDWQQILNLCYLSAYVFIASIALWIAIKALLKK